MVDVPSQRRDDLAAGEDLSEKREVAIDAGQRKRQRVFGHERTERLVHVSKELTMAVVAVGRRVDASATGQPSVAAGAGMPHGKAAGRDLFQILAGREKEA